MEVNWIEYAVRFTLFAASSFALLLVLAVLQVPSDLIHSAATLQSAAAILSLLDVLAGRRTVGSALLIFGTFANSSAGAAAAVATRPADPAALVAAAGLATMALSAHALSRGSHLTATALLCLSLELVALFITQSV